jgi:predicted transcriptional regulator with HTH domain
MFAVPQQLKPWDMLQGLFHILYTLAWEITGITKRKGAHTFLNGATPQGLSSCSGSPLITKRPAGSDWTRTWFCRITSSWMSQHDIISIDVGVYSLNERVIYWLESNELNRNQFQFHEVITKIIHSRPILQTHSYISEIEYIEKLESSSIQGQLKGVSIRWAVHETRNPQSINNVKQYTKHIEMALAPSGSA